MPAHPHCPQFKSRYITVFGREGDDTCQKGARQALAEICADFEEDIEYTPARFFPVPNRTTPTWCEMVQDLEKISPQTPEYTGVATVKYLHALDSLYEDQQMERTIWMNRYKDLEAELEKTNKELYKVNREKLALKHQLDICQKELHGIQQKLINKKRAKKAKKGKKTITKICIKNGEISYDPRLPYYHQDKYKTKESLSDQQTLETEESIADNQNVKETIDEDQGHADADGYARELYTLRDQQMAQEKKKAMMKDLYRAQFKQFNEFKQQCWQSLSTYFYRQY